MIAVPVRSKRLAAVLPALVLAAAGSVAVAQDGTASGTITGYQCGDNCYLTITSQSGEEHVGLCVAPECAAWNEVAEMPEDLIGKEVAVTLGVGTQFDAEGNNMGEMQAFEKIEFAD